MKIIQFIFLLVLTLLMALQAPGQDSVRKRGGGKIPGSKSTALLKNRSAKSPQENISAGTASNRSLRACRTINSESAYVDGLMNIR